MIPAIVRNKIKKQATWKVTKKCLNPRNMLRNSVGKTVLRICAREYFRTMRIILGLKKCIIYFDKYKVFSLNAKR